MTLSTEITEDTGALPVNLKVVEERSVGPDLGADSIRSGMIAALVGTAAVLMWMILSYGRFGIYASYALVLNVAMILAVMAMFNATLTLPGIAGIVLTVGIAVDSNVLIYERIREEVRAGRSALSALNAGFDRALATILDSNLTTFIAAAVLFYVGTGPVRGFAVVHCLGIMTSMFSGVFFSRGLVNLWYGRKNRLKTVSIGTVWRPDGGTALKAE